MGAFGLKIEGIESAMADLDAFQSQVDASGLEGVVVIAERAADIARDSMLAQPGVSRPGQPPAVLTSNLLGGLLAEAGLRTTAFLRSRSPHTFLLEYGTRKMAARPFLRLAVEKAIAQSGDVFRAKIAAKFMKRI